MNLTTDPWIPVVLHNGNPELVSLLDVFSRSGEITDLNVRPHERIALMRLLICIAQAALDGPENEEDWQGCKERMVPVALAYLGKWKSVFELFGEGPRFLQVQGLKRVKKGKDNGEEDDGNSVSKLDLSLATGNNSTLFDNAGGSDREFTSVQLALMLLTFQCFSPGGLIGQAQWAGISTHGRSAPEAPCVKKQMLHVIIRGQNLCETIHVNLLSKRQISQLYTESMWGYPLWEQMPTSLSDQSAIKNATETYLGRLLPLCRAILLENNGTMILANGLSYPEWREPTATIVKTRDQRHILRATIEKSIWRELSALIIKATDSTSLGGPVALRNLDDNKPFDLWVGAVITNPKNIAKVLDAVESVFYSLPAAFLDKPVQDTYEVGVHYADICANRVKYALTIFRLTMETNATSFEALTQKQARLKLADKKRLGKIGDKALAFYWTYIEQGLRKLQEFALGPLPMKDGYVQFQDTEWGRHVYRSALDAYAYSCTHETPRQMQAYVLGLKALTEF